MTVSSVPGSTLALAGNGSNNLWSFAFDVATSADLEVVRISEGGGSVIIDPTLYAVALIEGGDSGGVVTYPLNNSRVLTGESIIIRLAPDLSQPTRLRDEGDYSPERVEAALDHLARGIKATRSETTAGISQPAGYNIVFAPPIDGAPLFYRLLEDGSYQITPGSDDETGSGTPPDLRILYASDLGLRGDGTDETAEINAKLLELSSTDGRQRLIYLQSAAGYWPLSAELKVRSGISLTWGSPLRATKDGSMSFVGNVARYPTGALVAVAAAAGATTVAANPVDQGTLSTNFSVNDQIEIGSNRVRITAINSELNNLSVTPLARATEIGDTVRRHIFSYCVNSWTRDDTPDEIEVEDNSLFPVDRMVWICDDELTTHIDGVQTALVNNEMATVIGYGSGTIRLNRSIRHAMSTTERARVTLVDACEFATIAGATIEFTEAPDADRVDTFHSSFAFRCQFLQCVVPNKDNFGTRGRSFNLDRSYVCKITDCSSGPAKYIASGEGYGVALNKCTEVIVERFEGSGSRHVISFIGSTDCTASSIFGNAWANNLIDFHGQGEHGCWAYQVQGSGKEGTAIGGIALGNSSWTGGTFECGVDQGEITDIQGAGAKGIASWAGADDNEVRGVVFRRLARGIDLRDIAQVPTKHIGRLRISCDFHDCGEAVKVNMNFAGSGSKPLTHLDLSGSRWFDFINGMVIDNADEVIMRDIHMQTSVADTNDYAIDIQDCGTAFLSRLNMDGCQKHFKLANVPGARIENYTIRNPGTTVLIDELSASPVAGGVRDAYGTYPVGWLPARVSAQTVLTVLSNNGMT